MKKKITILLPNLKGGGAERVAVNLVNQFIERGYAVDMILMSAIGEFLLDLHPKVRVVDLKVRHGRHVLFPLMKYLRQVRPDALLLFMWPLTVFGLWAKLSSRINIRVVVVEHNTWSGAEIISDKFVNWFARTTMHYFFPVADAIVAVSKGAADDLAYFASLDRDTVKVIYNPVVDDKKLIAMEPMTPTEWWFGTHKRILAVGTLKAIKDYNTLLLAFAQLRKTVDARLLILGEGSCRSNLEEQAKNLEIENCLFLFGFVKELLPYYAHADLSILSSKSEGFGNVIVEALSTGTPVVSTDCQSGPSEILCGGQFGRLVPVGDVEAMAVAMAESLASTHDSVALKLRAQDFSISKAVDQYEKLLFPQAIMEDRS